MSSSSAYLQCGRLWEDFMQHLGPTVALITFCFYEQNYKGGLLIILFLVHNVLSTMSWSDHCHHNASSSLFGNGSFKSRQGLYSSFSIPCSSSSFCLFNLECRVIFSPAVPRGTGSVQSLKVMVTSSSGLGWLTFPSLPPSQG